MRVLGIDPGERRFGLALSDPSRRIALPLEVVEGEAMLLERAAELVRERDVGRIVLGLPLNMDGTIGPKALQSKDLGGRLASALEVPVEFWDERLTTVEAERRLRDGGLTGRRRSERVDKVAAQILLQSYLEARGREKQS